VSGPVLGADGRELDRINLVGVVATGHHGVLPEERRDGQPFGVDVVLHLDTRWAAAADDLALTVDYAALADEVAAIVAGPPVDLVETLAQRVADAALRRPGVEAVDVVVHKPRAPISVAFRDVRVEIRRRRGEPALSAPPAPGPPAPAPPATPPAPEWPSTADATVAGDPAPAPEEAPPGPPAGSSPLDRRPAGEVRAVLALGGNVGDVRATLRSAIDEIAALDGVTLAAVSPLARTAAVGPEQDDYLNAVVVVRTTLSPRELLAGTSAIEDAHGRVRDERWGPRTLDVDVIAIDGVTSSEPDLELPHPRARDRAFVLVPWALAEPGAELPGLGGGSVAVLAETAPDRAGIRWLALDWWHGHSTEPGETR
jgi:dihydroneopterin aldolase/2-amino-4-hydroxy-6-hydroxymethyldihydropteridine diphosphokinase